MIRDSPRAWCLCALAALCVSGLVLRYLLVAPYGFLLGEDAYFHREVTSYLVSSGRLPQYDILGWEAAHPYFLSLSSKLRAYPWGFHVLVYPFARTLGDGVYRLFPVVLSAGTPLAVYLFARELSGEEAVGFVAAALASTQDVVAHSVLLLPQGVGLLVLPLCLYLFLTTRYGAAFGAAMIFVHPFSAVIILVCVASLGLWRKEYLKTGRVMACAAVIVAAYIAMTLSTSSPGETFHIGAPLLVTYGWERYVDAFGLTLLFFLGIPFLRGHNERYLLVPVAILAFFSVFRVSNLPPERFFSFLSLLLACIAAMAVRGIRAPSARTAGVAVIVLVALVSCTPVFGHIGPSRVEMASWNHVETNTVDDATILGWSRYPQIFVTRRLIILDQAMGSADYVSPDTHLLSSPVMAARSSDAYQVIYDNYVPLMAFVPEGDE